MHAPMKKPRRLGERRGFANHSPMSAAAGFAAQAYFTMACSSLQRIAQSRALTRSLLCVNVLGTTTMNGTPHPVKTCGFFVPKTATNCFMARFGLYPGTKAPIRLADLRTNKGSRFIAVVAANTRRPYSLARVGLYQLIFDTWSNYAMSHENTTPSANAAHPIAQQINTLQDLAAAHYLRLSALQRLTAIARDAGEDYPLTGGEISATLEPLADDLSGFFELLESLLQRVEAEAANTESQAEAWARGGAK